MKLSSTPHSSISESSIEKCKKYEKEENGYESVFCPHSNISESSIEKCEKYEKEKNDCEKYEKEENDYESVFCQIELHPTWAFHLPGWLLHRLHIAFYFVTRRMKC